MNYTMTDTDRKNCGCGCRPQTASAYLIPQKIEAHAPLPMYKGDPFTYEDFTPEQIEDLQKPATEAAAEAQVLMAGFSKAEVIRERYEQSRVSAESERVAREELRQTAETARQANETAREAAEAKRMEAEDARRTAEQERATEFATWETEIDNKAERRELSNIMGVPTEEEIGDIDPTLVNEALRKVPQALTPQEQAQVKANLAISKMELFIDRWNGACIATNTTRPPYAVAVGSYNAETGYFELNELTDITYAQAQKIYSAHVCDKTLRGCRTNLPYIGDIQISNILTNGEGVEVFWGNPLRYTPFNYVQNADVREYRYISINSFVPYLFQNHSRLETIRDIVITAKGNMLLISSPKLSLETLNILVTANPEGNTITVHPDVYAKLTDETNTEWHQVLIDAASKNITFATV